MTSYGLGLENLSQYLDQVDDKLKSFIPQHISGLDRLLESRGKRLRPSLVIAIAHYGGKAIDDSVINAAAAVELIHLASLIHDDIIDHGTLRWGTPTINAEEGSDIALLAGDYLFSKGCSLATTISAEAGVIIADTIASLCIGQAQELKDQYNLNRSVSSLNIAIEGKTSSLFVATCKLGGIVAGLDQKQIDILANYANYLGLAFQYNDDINDFVNKDSDKNAQSDIESGNYTYPIILSLNGPNKDSLIEVIKDSTNINNKVLKILKSDGSIDKANRIVATCKYQAMDSLNELNNAELKTRLIQFIKQILNYS